MPRGRRPNQPTRGWRYGRIVRTVKVNKIEEPENGVNNQQIVPQDETGQYEDDMEVVKSIKKSAKEDRRKRQNVKKEKMESIKNKGNAKGNKNLKEKLK